jgi:3-oxoacyl-[acyl-carrier-protein] synthase II
MGCLNSLGHSPEEMFSNLKDGKSGVQLNTEWQKMKGLESHLCAPVRDFSVSDLPRQVRRSMSRMSEMASLASQQALKQAKLFENPEFHSPRTLIIFGSTTGSPATMESQFRLLLERGGPEGQVSTSFLKMMNHSVAANVASSLDFKGGLLGPSSACTTSAQAIILGWELLQTGLYDRVLAGGADELHYMSAGVFDVVFAASRGFSDRPSEAPRPFDKDRDGLVVAEGAGAVLLETEQAAAARGSKPLAELMGGAYSCEGSHMTQNNHAAMISAMEGALSRSNLKKEDIAYVNAHATGTRQGDAEEAVALEKMFSHHPPVSSLKAHLGHSLAACGAIEVISCVKMFQENCLIPTRNLSVADEYCSKINLIKGPQLTPFMSKYLMSNNAAFGGVSTSLILARA